jgi:hypothetical protein
VDENNLNKNSKAKWKQELVVANGKQTQTHVIGKLKLETVYYFKIQSRNHRSYGASSSTIIYKTPNAKGEGGGKVFMPNEFKPQLVLNSLHTRAKKYLEMNIVWIVSACVISFIILAVLLSTVLLCKRANGRKRNNYRGGSKRRIVNSSNYAHRDEQFDQINDDDLIDENCSLAFQKQTTINHHQQQQHLMVNNMSHMCSTSSATSTLLKHQRTPHHQPLIINNPNHMMMNLMNPLCVNSNNSSNLNEMEFYSNMTNQHQPQQLFTNSSHQTDTNMCAFNSNESCMNGNQNYFNDQLNQSCDNDNTSAAIAAANAAFNAPINGIPQATLNQANTNTDMMFVRHTIKPKPIAIPIGNQTSQTDSFNNTLSSVQSSVFGNSNQRKSFRNLPMATATLIASNGMQMNSNQLSSNYSESVLNKQHQAQKIHYTARPYIVDNQVQPSKLNAHYELTFFLNLYTLYIFVTFYFKITNTLRIQLIQLIRQHRQHIVVIIRQFMTKYQIITTVNRFCNR